MKGIKEMVVAVLLGLLLAAPAWAACTCDDDSLTNTDGTWVITTPSTTTTTLPWVEMCEWRPRPWSAERPGLKRCGPPSELSNWCTIPMERVCWWERR
jgi:hypothetical protein